MKDASLQISNASVSLWESCGCRDPLELGNIINAITSDVNKNAMPELLPGW